MRSSVPATSRPTPRARRTLGGFRDSGSAELDYVLDTVRSLARQKRLTARLRPMFLILDRNREWWAKAGPPGSGARLTSAGAA